jgi:hypothetical protein
MGTNDLLKPHPIHGLIGTLIWNYMRHLRGRSTICSTSRPWVGPIIFCVFWTVLSAWLLPHYMKRAKFLTKPWLP